MPNLEFHGFDIVSPHLHKKIKDLFKDALYYKEIVLGYQGSYVVNLHDYQKAPFVRVWATSQTEIEDIIKRLETLVMDIEVAPLLHSFIEKRSVTIGGADKD